MGVDSWFEGFLEEGPLTPLVQYIGGVLYVNGFPINTTQSVADQSLLPSAAANTALIELVTGLGRAGTAMVSNGVDWMYLNGRSVLYQEHVSISCVGPAVTFDDTGYTVTDGGSGTILITSTGGSAHGSSLTTGQNIYISGGTGFTPGFYPIVSWPSASSVKITGTFVTGMAAPVISLVGDVFTFRQITIPPLLAHSRIIVDTDWTCTSSGSNKVASVKLGSDVFMGVNLGAVLMDSTSIRIKNMGSKSVQNGSFSAGNAANRGTSGAGSVIPTGSTDTSVASTLTI